MDELTNNPTEPALQARRATADAVAWYVAQTLGDQLERDLPVWLEHSGVSVEAAQAMTQPADWLPLVVARMRLMSALQMPPEPYDPDVANYFGNCPICGSAGVSRDIGQWIYMACDAHQLCWDGGGAIGLLHDACSDWTFEALAAAYAEGRAALQGYRVIDPFNEARYPRTPADVRTFVQRLRAGEGPAKDARPSISDTWEVADAASVPSSPDNWSQEASYNERGLLTGPESEAMLLERLGLSREELELFLAGDDSIGYRLLRSSHRHVVLKRNARTRHVPCAICGDLVIPRGGLEPVVRGTRALVCLTCTDHFAPGLRKLIGRGWYEHDPVTLLLARDGDQFGAAPHEGSGQEWTEADAARIIAQLAR